MKSYRVTHTTEPAHHRAARLCAARWSAAKLCVIRLACAEGHPWYYLKLFAFLDVRSSTSPLFIFTWHFTILLSPRLSSFICIINCVLVWLIGNMYMNSVHNDVIKWKHFSRYWPFVRGIHRWIPHTKASDTELWCFFDLRLNKRLSKQAWGWWFETLSRPLCRHCNIVVYGRTSSKIASGW